MKIHIETEPFATDYWYEGCITIDVGDNLEKKEENYDFTIHNSENSQTITWADNTPENNEEIEKQILEQFYKTI